MRLKSWESPRKQGRNDKGKGGSARQRQLKKQQQMLRKKLKGDEKINEKPDKNKQNNQNGRIRERDKFLLSYFLEIKANLRICKLCNQ
jgi:hypothetical protein